MVESVHRMKMVVGFLRTSNERNVQHSEIETKKANKHFQKNKLKLMNSLSTLSRTGKILFQFSKQMKKKKFISSNEHLECLVDSPPENFISFFFISFLILRVLDSPSSSCYPKSPGAHVCFLLLGSHFASPTTFSSFHLEDDDSERRKENVKKAKGFDRHMKFSSTQQQALLLIHIKLYSYYQNEFHLNFIFFCIFMIVRLPRCMCYWLVHFVIQFSLRQLLLLLEQSKINRKLWILNQKHENETLAFLRGFWCTAERN